MKNNNDDEYVVEYETTKNVYDNVLKIYNNLFDINEKYEENNNFISYNESNKENIKKINNALNLLEDVVNDLKKQI